MLLTPLPTLENELVRLRPMVPADREALYLIARDRLLWEQHQCPDRHERHVFDRFIDESLLSLKGFTLEDRATGQVIGGTRIREISSTATEIGFTFLARHLWGTGYNGSMKRLLIDYIFDQDKDILFYVNDCNKRSQRAVEKLGAERIQDSRHPYYRDEPDGISYILRRTSTRPASPR